ncbi:MAG: hypothetical protein FWG61_03040 [Firmicutes bacterium]|nr:hypothetical protein [Bacillota bacterium]
MKKYLWLICLLLVVLCGACSAADQVNAVEEANAALAQAAATDEKAAISPSQDTATSENTDVDTTLDTAAETLEESLAIANAADIIVIKEKMFIAQTNDITLNARSYEGKTIEVEGMYFGYFDPYSEREYNYVQRRSPGCCGNDGMVGYEILYDGEMPEINDWIEVIGQIEVVQVENKDAVRVRVSQLTVKDERGAEFVRF